MKNNIRKVLSVVLGCFSLVGCSSIEKPNIPQDYADQLASIEGGTVENVNFNTKDQYYTNFTDANDTALNNLLLTVAQKASNGQIKNGVYEVRLENYDASNESTYYYTTNDVTLATGYASGKITLNPEYITSSGTSGGSSSSTDSSSDDSSSD